MASLKELEGYFNEEARLEMRSDFECKCVLCKMHLKASEGHFVPLMLDARMVRISYHPPLGLGLTTSTQLGRTIHALYHRVFAPYAAVNGLYGERPCSSPIIHACILTVLACKPCGNQWLMAPDGNCPWGVLVPCIPLMLYAIHILSLANEDAPCLQTLDEVCL